MEYLLFISIGFNLFLLVISSYVNNRLLKAMRELIEQQREYIKNLENQLT